MTSLFQRRARSAVLSEGRSMRTPPAPSNVSPSNEITVTARSSRKRSSPRSTVTARCAMVSGSIRPRRRTAAASAYRSRSARTRSAASRNRSRESVPAFTAATIASAASFASASE